MTKPFLVALAVSSAGALLPAAAPAASYQLDCSRPMYVPADSGPGVIKSLLAVGVPGVILLEEGKAVPDGALVLLQVNATISKQAKYFGPANWFDYTCRVERYTIGLKSGEHVAIVYDETAEATQAQLFPDQEISPCTEALRAAMAGLSCRPR